MMQTENLLNHCDMELMKLAMLKHEETFRQQVHELHRLYRVQKQLMMSGPSSCRRQRRKHPRRALDLHLSADGATPPSREDDELELTLAVGGVCGRRKRRDDGSATTPVASSDFSGDAGSRSSSTDTSGSPYQRVAAFGLHEGTVMRRQQQQQAPWLARCLSLRMA